MPLRFMLGACLPLKIARSGNVAVVFALVAPLLIGAAGAGYDFWRLASFRAQLQNVADMAALAGVREFMIAKEGRSVAEARAEAMMEAALTTLPQAVNVKIEATSGEDELTTTIHASFRPSALVALWKNPLSFAVDATASVVGAANVCVIGLDDAAGSTISLDDSAQLSGPTCAAYSNSTAPKSFKALASSKVTTALNCTAGGYDGNPANFHPTPQTDCPPREDPLATLMEPSPGACTQTDFERKDFVGSIWPGVYCGGIKIDGTSEVTLQPGDYFVVGGKVEIKDQSKVTGSDVSMHISGNDVHIIFEESTEIALSARVAGPMAGVLFWLSAGATGTPELKIKSNHVDEFVGTIYLPGGKFKAESTASVAGGSAYTAIIADAIELKNNTNLVLNTDYALTPVPVPAGIAGASEARLRD